MTTPHVNSSSCTPTSEYPKYPLNSFSREETALKVGALVLAFLCIGGAVATAVGGQFVLPEIIMAPIPQVIVQSLLGVTALGLLVQVVVFSVQGQSKQKNTLEQNSNLNRVPSAASDQLTEEKEAQATIGDLQATIEQLRHNNAEHAQKIDKLKGAIQTAETDAKAVREANKTLNTKISALEATNQKLAQEKEELVLQGELAKKGFEDEKATLEEANEKLTQKEKSLEEMNAAYQKEHDEIKVSHANEIENYKKINVDLEKANKTLNTKISALEATNQKLAQEKEELVLQGELAKKGFEDEKATLEEANEELKNKVSTLEKEIKTYMAEKEQVEAS